MEISREVFFAGDYDNVPADLARLAWDECIELQVRPREVFAEQMLRQVAEAERIEYRARDGAGQVVGGLICALEHGDIHVGTCLSALFHFVQPAYRNRGLAGRFLRLMLREAEKHGIPCIAYSHRAGPWTYKTTYKRVRHGKGC